VSDHRMRSSSGSSRYQSVQCSMEDGKASEKRVKHVSNQYPHSEQSSQASSCSGDAVYHIDYDFLLSCTNTLAYKKSRFETTVYLYLLRCRTNDGAPKFTPSAHRERPISRDIWVVQALNQILHIIIVKEIVNHLCSPWLNKVIDFY
jgi:hypothetical protein